MGNLSFKSRRAKISIVSEKEKVAAKAKYRDYLVQGVKVLNEREIAPRFDLLGEAPPKMAVDQDTEKAQASLLGKAKGAIVAGNVETLEVYLGPSYHQHHVSTNQEISQLRWDWLAAREKVDLYAQAFNLAVWYVRKHVFERQFQGELLEARQFVQRVKPKMYRPVVGSAPATPRGTATVTVRSEFFNRRPDGVWIPIPVGAELVEDPAQYRDPAPRADDDTIAYYRRRIVVIRAYETAYQDKDIVELQDAQALLAYGVAFRQTFKPDLFRELCEHAAHSGAPVLSASKWQHLKRLLVGSLAHSAQIIGTEHLASLAKGTFAVGVKENDNDSDEKDEKHDVKTEPNAASVAAKPQRALIQLSPVTVAILQQRVAKHAYKNSQVRKAVTAEIEQIFARTADVGILLHQLFLLWQVSVASAQTLAQDYESLIDEKTQLVEERRLTDEYRKLSAVKRLHGKEEIDMEEVIRNGVGRLLLPKTMLEGANHFFEEALLACKKHPIPRERKKYLEIAAYLIRRGFSVFDLPMFKPKEKEESMQEVSVAADAKQEDLSSVLTREEFPWEILAATLEMMVCITPVAEEIRQVLVNYANKSISRDKASDVIGKNRRCAVTQLMWLLHDSQQRGTLEEDVLVQQVKLQIENAPRGVLGNSALYADLQAILKRIDDHELMQMTAEVDMGSVMAPVRGAALFALQGTPMQQRAPRQAVDSDEDENEHVFR